MIIKLTDLQRVLLSAAAARADGNMLPLPDSVAVETARVMKAVSALLKRGLVEQVDVTDPAHATNEEGERRVGARITAAGHAAIGTRPAYEDQAPEQTQAEPQPAPAPERSTKATQVLALLRREQGATLAELVNATGWLPHTTRAALTDLRKKGHVLDKGKRDDVTCYRIAGAA